MTDCRRCGGPVGGGHETPLCGRCYREVDKMCLKYVSGGKGTAEEAQEKFFFPYLSEQAKRDIRRSWEGKR
jgi:hypothetical protein